MMERVTVYMYHAAPHTMLWFEYTFLLQGCLQLGEQLVLSHANEGCVRQHIYFTY